MTTLGDHVRRIIAESSQEIRDMGTSLMQVLAGPWRRMNALLIERKKASLDLEVERKRSLRWLDEHYEADPREIHKEYSTSASREWFLRLRDRLPDSSQTSSAFDCESHSI